MPRTIYLLSLCQALMMSSNALMVTVAALVGSMLVEDKSLATLPLAMQFLATMLSTTPASLMMGRFGRKARFLFATIIGMSGGALAAYAIIHQDFWLFCLAALLLGTFNAFGSYYRFAAAEDVDEAHRSRAISYVLAGGIIAAFVGPNLANYGQNLLPGARFAGSFTFIIALYALSMLLIGFAKFDRTKVAHPSHAGRPLPIIARQPKAIGVFGDRPRLLNYKSTKERSRPLNRVRNNLISGTDEIFKNKNRPVINNWWEFRSVSFAVT